jgi:hypothetical protein
MVADEQLLYAKPLSILRSHFKWTFQTVYRKKFESNGSWIAWLECTWGTDKLTAASNSTFNIYNSTFNQLVTRIFPV